MSRARTATPETRAAQAAVGEADAQVGQARSGYFPRVDLSETLQRGNHPVFAFSSLLSQRRFTEANFAIASLNNPDPVTNTRTALSIEQPVFDAGLTRLSVRAAELTRDVARVNQTRTEQDLAVRAAQAFVRVLQTEAALRASNAAVDAAGADLHRARARRDAGLVTDADVLAVEVHVADMRQRQIALTGDMAVARLELAESVGLPPGEVIELETPPLAPDSPPPADVTQAQQVRWESREAALQEALADNARRTAQANYLPTLGVQGGWELNGSTLANQRSSWVIGAVLQVNVFRGFGDAAQLARARSAVDRARAERERVERRIEVDVRAAVAQLEAAQARQNAGRTALAQARESQRIIRDRYESGLATITDVLRAAEAVLAAESRATAADMDVILQRVALQRALGSL